MLNKAMHKARLTKNKKAKHTSNAKKKKKNQEGGKRKKVTKSLRVFFFFHTLEEPFRLANL